MFEKGVVFDYDDIVLEGSDIVEIMNAESDIQKRIDEGFSSGSIPIRDATQVIKWTLTQTNQ